MHPTEILMEEHRVIEQVLNCLEEMANRCQAGQPLDTESANQAVDFIREFADRCHHAKEEDLLFPLMEQKGFSREHGPTGVMLDEHEEGRRHVRLISDAIAQVAAGNAAGSTAFIEHSRALVQLLRQHIFKEDHCLFPMADETFSAVDQDQLGRSFDRVEHDDLGPDTHERYLRVAARLADRFGIANIVSTSGSSGCGCHHQSA